MRRFYLLALLIFLPWSVWSMPEKLLKNNNIYLKCQQHEIKYAMLISVAKAAVYLPQCDARNFLNSDDKILRFDYYRDIKRNFFIDAAEKFFLKNHQSADGKQLQELKRFNELYEDIKENDSYELFHRPDGSLGLYKNSKLLANSQIPSFAFKYFEIWFGKFPAIKSLKRAFIDS